ncbi:MAG: hypothetical protein Q8R71_03960 [Phenylobacterium sp.]|nr:hypothetical protein [Phenylobacterium sp.]
MAACSETDPEAASLNATPPAPEGQVEVAAPTHTGFSHVAGEDLFGYYIPSQEVRIGELRLDHLHIGGAAEFAAWEGGDRMATYAPVMLEFSDLSSPVETNELGGEAHSVRIRVLPTSYKLGNGEFRFAGEAPGVGQVRLDGQLDLEALRSAQGSAVGGEPPVILRTAGQIGPERLRTLSFTWFGGD